MLILLQCRRADNRLLSMPRQMNAKVEHWLRWWSIDCSRDSKRIERCIHRQYPDDERSWSMYFVTYCIRHWTRFDSVQRQSIHPYESPMDRYFPCCRPEDRWRQGSSKQMIKLRYTYHNAVVVLISNHFIFEFFPTFQRFIDQQLRGMYQCWSNEWNQFFRIISKARAKATQSKSRSEWLSVDKAINMDRYIPNENRITKSFGWRQGLQKEKQKDNAMDASCNRGRRTSSKDVTASQGATFSPISAIFWANNDRSSVSWIDLIGVLRVRYDMEIDRTHVSRLP